MSNAYVNNGTFWNKAEENHLQLRILQTVSWELDGDIVITQLQSIQIYFKEGEYIAMAQNLWQHWSQVAKANKKKTINNTVNQIDKEKLR